MIHIKDFNKRFIKTLLFVKCLCISLLANGNSEIGINNFELKTDNSAQYQNLHLTLYKRLLYELLPHGIKPVLLENEADSNCIAVIHGSINTHNDIPILSLTLLGTTSNKKEIKTIPLMGLENDQLLDIIILKIRYFLEQNVSGILRISSTPLGCAVLLNGITIGTTPAELTLEKGSYVLKLQHDNLRPFIDTINILSGTEQSVQTTLRFEGFKQKPWLLSASFLTICTTISWIIEGSLHKSYSDIPQKSPQWYSDKPYKNYRAANYFRIALLNTTALCWTVNGFIMVRNNSLKKKIFGK